MDEVIHDNALSKFTTWALGILAAVITFIGGLITKLRMDVSTLQKDIAVNTEVERQLKEQVNKLEGVIIKNDEKMDTVLLVVQDQKEMFITLASSLNKLLDELN